MNAEDAGGASFYYKETTQESQWEVPTNHGYTREDTRLVPQDGTVIDDPDIAMNLEASATSTVPSDQLASVSTKNDSSMVLAQMLVWKEEEDDI